LTTEDVKAIAHPVLRHRIVTTFQANSEGVSPDDVVDQLLDEVPVELHHRAKKLVP
jgi:MoxR-like ATPase